MPEKNQRVYAPRTIAKQGRELDREVEVSPLPGTAPDEGVLYGDVDERQGDPQRR